jgi:hypothetical protein
MKESCRKGGTLSLLIKLYHNFIYVCFRTLSIYMKAWKELLLFSTNSRLAYHINSEFYGCHYVWCSPVYQPGSLDVRDLHYKIPASSSPADIYLSFSKACKGDGHSDLIKNNRNGIIRGATQKLSDEKIVDTNHARIVGIAKKATLIEFEPMLYIIRYDLVKDRIKEVPVKLTANPLGIEYRITDLQENEFEIIQPVVI